MSIRLTLASSFRISKSSASRLYGSKKAKFKPRGGVRCRAQNAVSFAKPIVATTGAPSRRSRSSHARNRVSSASAITTRVKGVPRSMERFQAATGLPSIHSLVPSTWHRPVPDNKAIYAAPPRLSGGRYFFLADEEIWTYLHRRSCFSFVQTPTTSAGNPSSPSTSFPIPCSPSLYSRPRLCFKLPPLQPPRLQFFRRQHVHRHGFDPCRGLRRDFHLTIEPGADQRYVTAKAPRQRIRRPADNGKALVKPIRGH